MDRLPQKMEHQIPKLPNKELPPVLFGTSSPLRGFLTLFLSPRSGLRRKKRSTGGRLGSVSFLSLGEYRLLAQSVLLEKGHVSCQGSIWKPQDGILATSPKDLTWNST